MLKRKSIDYIFGMITGAALMLALWSCTYTPLEAGASEIGSNEWNPMYVKIVD